MTGTTANIRVFCTDDMVNTTTGGFRVNYSTNPDVSLSTKTAYTDFSARVHDCAHIRITGLEPDTRYYYKIHFVDDTGSPVANYSTTEFRSFKTLATADHDATPDSSYRDIVAQLSALADAHDRIAFVDLNRDGDNVFTDADWGNFDHLNERGARILTQQISDVLNDVFD